MIAVIVVYVLLGCLLLFSLIVFIAASCMLCCGKSSCRNLLYFGCGFLVLLGLICFCLATIFSIVTPISYFTCTYIETGLSGKSQFEANFSPLFSQAQNGN